MTLRRHEIEETTAWLRRLALLIARDPHEADDLVQEVYLRLLQRDAKGSEYPRSRLGAMVRLLFLERRRKQQRRSHHEAVAGKELPVATVERELELRDFRQKVESTIDGLEEPYRSVARASILEGLRSTEIARVQGAEASTVRTQLERARGRIRSRLSERLAGFGLLGWQRALGSKDIAPLSVDPVAWADAGASPLRSHGVGLGVLGALGLALVLISIFGGWDRGGDGPRRVEVPPAVARIERNVGSTDSSPPETALPGPLRRSLGTTSDPGGPLDGSAGSSGAQVLRGRVVEVDGRGVADTSLYLAPQDFELPWEIRQGEAIARTDSEGWFSVSAPEVPGRWVVSDEHFATLASPLSFAGETDVVTVIVGRRVTLSGRVTLEGGDGAGGARVEAMMPREAWDRLRPDGRPYALERWETHADPEGYFEFPSIPRMPELVVRGGLVGYASAEVRPFVDSEVIDPWPLVLSPTPRNDRGWLREGIVLDPLGERVPDAWITWGVGSVRSDGRGSFQLPDDLELEGLEVAAVAQGYLPSGPGTLGFWARGGRGVEVVLGERPRRIDGLVLDSDGSVLPGALVWTSQGTDFGVVSVPFEGRTALRHARVEDLAGRGNPAFHGMRSTVDGEFRLDGLFDREYDLYALHPRTLALAVRRGVSAGEEEVRIRFESVSTAFEAKVIDEKGEGVSGVRLRFGREVPFDLAGEGTRVFYIDRFASSGPSGEVRVEEIDTRGLRLAWRAPGIVDGHAAAPQLTPDGPRIRVRRQATLRVHVAEDFEPALLEVLDPRGAPLLVYLDLPSVQRQHVTHQVHLVPGTTHWMACTPEAGSLRVTAEGTVHRHVIEWPDSGPLELGLDRSGFTALDDRSPR